MRYGPDALSDEFAILVCEWKASRSRGVDVAQMVEHPAYKRIIQMGEPVVPLVLKELEREIDHWFPALRHLTGARPVPMEGKGNLAEMRAAWLAWGKDEALI